MNQPGDAPTAAPVPKVAAAGAGGLLGTIIVSVLELAGVDVPTEVSAAIATVLAFGAGYLKRA